MKARGYEEQNMDWNPEEEDRIRRYLLDDATEDERRQVEARLLEDDDYDEWLLLIEDELIDDYARGALPERERELFARNFLVTPQRRQDLTFAREMAKYSSAGGGPEPTTAQFAQGTAQEADKVRRDHAGRVSEERRERPWPASQWWRALILPGWKIAAYAVLALAIGLTVWWPGRDEPEVERGLAALKQVYREERPIESRLANFDYVPFQVTRGADDPEKKADYRALDEAEVLLRRAARVQANAQAWQALGQLYLIKQEPEKAADQFKEALKQDSGNARLHSDLAAALLEQARRQSPQAQAGRRSELLAESLEHLNQALKLDPGLPEALFNRALVYEYLSQPQEAAADWQRYLELDPSSPWTDEAKDRLKALANRRQKISQAKEQLFDQFIDAAQAADGQRAWLAYSNSRARTGNLITERLLEQWESLVAQQQWQEAQRRLRLIEYAGRLEESHAGDLFTVELTAFYHAAADRQSQLTAARQVIKAARIEFNRSRFESAARLYDAAADQFLAVGNFPEAMLARCWQGHSLLRIPKLDESLAIHRELAEVCSQRRYRWLHSQSLNAIADNQSSRSEFSLAISYAEQAREIAGQIGDQAGVLRNLQLALSMKLRFGRYGESLSYAEQALSVPGVNGFDPRQRWPFYFENALNFLHLGYPGAAYASLQEALRLAREADWPLIICRSYTRLGLFHDAAQDYAEALRFLQLALAEGQKLAPEEGQINLTSYVWLQMGQSWLKSGAPQQALPCFDKAIEEFGQLKLPYELFRARKGRLQTLIQLAHNNEVQPELDKALTLYELHRQTINEEADRNSFFDREQGIYDTAISFAFSVKYDAQQAFQYAEASRSRALLDLRQERIRPARTGESLTSVVKALIKPLPLSEIRRRIPAGAQLVEYAVLPDRLIIWVVSRQQFHAVEQQIGAGELRRRVEDFRQLVARRPTANAPDYQPAARKLYDILIAPVRERLRRQELLCLAPDGPLHGLPFAALLAPDGRTYLLDEYPLTLSPGASLFVLCAESGERRPAGPERLLAVGDPAFDPAKYAHLPELQDAEREVKEIAALYPPTATLMRRQATKARVVREMTQSEIIHLAAHAEVDRSSPAEAKLVLAFDETAARAEGGDSDNLRAFEIYRMKLPHVRLAVLSACSTATGQTVRGEGAMSFARAFIAAGAPTVVASLWKVNSAATADLMIDLHRQRIGARLSASAALNKSQQRLRENGLQHPYYWAAFISFGI